LSSVFAYQYFFITEASKFSAGLVIKHSLHDVAVTGMIKPKSVIFQNFTLDINFTVTNVGIYPETYNFTFKANSTELFFSGIEQMAGDSANMTFSWNTTSFAKGNYTLNAYAEPVPEESCLSDNTQISWVIVSRMGDVTGPNGYPDGKVDMRDIGSVARLFFVSHSDQMYNPDFDVIYDGIINMKDVGLVARHFGEMEG